MPCKIMQERINYWLAQIKEVQTSHKQKKSLSCVHCGGHYYIVSIGGTHVIYAINTKITSIVSTHNRVDTFHTGNRLGFFGCLI
jgi:hypothetical protein